MKMFYFILITDERSSETSTAAVSFLLFSCGFIGRTRTKTLTRPESRKQLVRISLKCDSKHHENMPEARDIEPLIKFQLKI